MLKFFNKSVLIPTLIKKTIIMKKLLLIITATLLFISCKKSDDTSDNSRISGNITVKYEIITTSNVTTSRDFPQTGIMYTNGTGQPEFLNNFTSGRNWTKTVTINTNQRPVLLNLRSGNFVIITSSGSITGNIYVNDKKVVTVTNPTTSGGSIHFGFVVLTHTIK